MAVLVIGGPTAVGKSQLALDIAKQIQAPIVSADAMTIYRDLDIGTAKPSAQELAEVQHFCVNIRNYNEPYTVGDFVEDVERVIVQHKHVVIAGGTPYYLNALFRPLAPLPESQPAIRSSLEQLINPHERLQQIDSISAERLHPNDRGLVWSHGRRLVWSCSQETRLLRNTISARSDIGVWVGDCRILDLV